ncbi:MAG: type II secretion system F family protein [Planctomycetales bacterium]|nr:type II secretion system F family protein [Planctomycetales bacterium]
MTPFGGPLALFGGVAATLAAVAFALRRRGSDLAAQAEALEALERAVLGKRPIPQALALAAADAPPGPQDSLRESSRILDAGGSLAESLAAAPRIFPAPLRALVAAAESRGAVAKVLPGLADHGRETLAFRSRLLLALAYPVAAAVVAGILAWTSARWLGPLTEAPGSRGAPRLFPVAVALTAAALLLPLAAVGLAGAVAIARRSAPGRRATDALADLVPGLRGIRRDLWLSDATRLLGAFAEMGAPLPDALTAAAAVEGPPAARRALGRAAALVAEGTPLSEALTPAVPRWARWRAALGLSSPQPAGLAGAFRALGAEASLRAEAGLDRAARAIYPATVLLLAALAATWLATLATLSAGVGVAAAGGG